MIITSQPADLLPSSAFWYTMAHADLFDLRIFDPIHALGRQRRVMMRGQWVSVPIIAGPAGSLISDARTLPAETPRVLMDLVHEHYRDATYWHRHGPHILDMIDQVRTEHLWQFNLQLILGVRELLDIRTPVSIGRAPLGSGGDGLASVMAAYRATTYLSDTAGRAYVTGDERYGQHGVSIAWSAHRPVTGDSILSILMDYEDPMEIVLAEHGRHQSSRATGLSA